MPGLVPGIHVFRRKSKTWMAGTSPAMTSAEWNIHYTPISWRQCLYIARMADSEIRLSAVP